MNDWFGISPEAVNRVTERYRLAYATCCDAHVPWHTYCWQVQRLTQDSLGGIRAFFDAGVWTNISPIVDTVAACQRLHDRANRWIASCTVTTGFAAEGRSGRLPAGTMVMALARIFDAVAQAAAIEDMKP